MISLQSPAKINLFLRILGKRSDGYHAFASLMQTIDLCDTIEAAKSDADHFSCSDPQLAMDPSNLVCKAVALFRRKTGITQAFTIHLVKRIPMEAGLGGGSSNAATTLWALNTFCGGKATVEELIEWGGEIGSDIPFFLSTGTAYCTGRGEKVQPLSPLTSQKLWIIKPQEGLSTPDVYRNLKLDSLQNRDPDAILKAFFSGQPTYFNDLESSAFSIRPSLLELKQNLLAQGFSIVLMSGSGSSFFAIGDAAPRLPGAQVHRVSFIHRAPHAWY